MHARTPFALLPTEAEHALVVELIGDLDAALVRSLAEVLGRLDGADGGPIVVRLKHLSTVRPTGIAALGAALAEQRRRGRNVSAAAESGRITAMLRAAGVPLIARGAKSAAGVRHVMIVRSGKPAKDCA
jgi:anti-anti-sigma regulatory factor